MRAEQTTHRQKHPNTTPEREDSQQHSPTCTASSAANSTCMRAAQGSVGETFPTVSAFPLASITPVSASTIDSSPICGGKKDM